MFTPERLILARKRRRMTLAALSRSSHISVQSINAFEKGRKTPSDETLSVLAGRLSYPIDFFHGSPLDEMQPDAVSFRAPSKMTALDRDSNLSAGVIASALNSWIEKRFRVPSPDVPTYPHLHPEEAAESVRAYWKLGESPVPNVVRVLEANGVRIFSLPSDCLDADAFSTIRHQVPYVLLNTRKSPERGRFDAAHELGHLVLHCEHRIPHGADQESEANEFASAFLMPRAAIFAQSLNNASVERILSAKRRWGVSAMALTYRIRQLGILSEWRYNQNIKELSKRGYRNSEPNSLLVREKSEVLAKVFGALRGQGTSLSEMATDIGIFHEELNEYVFGLVPITPVKKEGRGDPSKPARPNLQVVGGQ